MKATIRLAVLLALTANLTACSGHQWLRDWYMGQKLIEPELVPQPAPRDEMGNPRLKPQRSSGFRQEAKP